MSRHEEHIQTAPPPPPTSLTYPLLFENARLNTQSPSEEQYCCLRAFPCDLQRRCRKFHQDPGLTFPFLQSDKIDQLHGGISVGNGIGVGVWIPISMHNARFKELYLPIPTPSSAAIGMGVWYCTNSVWAVTAVLFFRNLHRIQTAQLTDEERVRLGSEQRIHYDLMCATLESYQRAYEYAEEINNQHGQLDHDMQDRIESMKFMFHTMWVTGSHQQIFLPGNRAVGTVSDYFLRVDKQTIYLVNLGFTPCEMKETELDDSTQTIDMNWDKDWNSFNGYADSRIFTRVNFSWAHTKKKYMRLDGSVGKKPGFSTLYRQSLSNYGI